MTIFETILTFITSFLGAAFFLLALAAVLILIFALISFVFNINQFRDYVNRQ